MALSPPPAIYIARNMQMQERGSLMEVTGITSSKGNEKHSHNRPSHFHVGSNPDTW
jgi:hypothetical protein